MLLISVSVSELRVVYVKDKLVQRIDVMCVLFWDELLVVMVALNEQLFIWK